MNKLTTISTYRDVAGLTKIYCTLKGIPMKDYVSDVLKKELKGFEHWLSEKRKL